MKQGFRQRLRKKLIWIAIFGLIIIGIGTGFAFSFVKSELAKNSVVRNLHRMWSSHHASPSMTGATPAGLAAADLTADGLELSGWAPADASIQILDHGKPVALITAGGDGRWSTAYAADKDRRDIQVLTVTYQEKEKTSLPMGRLMLLMADSSSDDAYLWWQGSVPGTQQLLEAPDSDDENDLSLILTWVREGQPVIFAGRGAPDSMIEVYLNNQLAGMIAADHKGFWILRSLVPAEKKGDPLRFEEIRKVGHVAERRSYRLGWPDLKESASDDVTLAHAGDNWVAATAIDGGKGLIYILRPETGEALSADDEIPGQIMPLALPDSSR